jgi:3-dehydroquinate synthase
MRGIRWVCLPTTLLAQVDAGLGGKVGINLNGAKNMVGAFWQPAAVACDTAFLRSLNAKQKISGLGEMVKCALLSDRGLFEALRRDWKRILDLEEPALSRAMRACVRYKMRVVAKDERDADGTRELLNLGHTFSHALESISAPELSHGEAVIWGLRAAVFISRGLGLMEAAVCASIQEFLGVLPACGFRHRAAPAEFLRRLRQDKKRAYGGNRFVLLRGPARPVVVDRVPERLLRGSYQWLKRRSQLCA